MEVPFILGILLTIWLTLLSYGTSKDVSRPAVVNIGAIFTFKSSIGRVAKVAIQAAVDDVNSNPTILHGTMLNVTMLDSEYNPFLGFVQALELMSTDAIAIVGPQSSVVAHIISTIESELQVPVLSFGATDPTLTPLQYPYFIRTTHSDTYQMTAVADIIEYYDWNQVIAIFTDDDYGRNGISALDSSLSAQHYRISNKVAIRPGPSVSRSEALDILIKVSMLESRVIVLHVSADTGFMVFEVAQYLQMTSNGYIWITTDWLSDVLDTSSPLPSEKMDTIQGVLSLRIHTPDSDRKKSFAARWRNLTGGSFGLNVHGLYAYDSVLLVAHALDRYLSQDNNITFSKDFSTRRFSTEGRLHLEALNVFNEGETLVKDILQSNIIGLTGNLKFDSDRSLLHPAYDVINVIGTGYHVVGYWSNYSGLSVVPPETLYDRPPNVSSANQHLKSVLWPGGATDVPRGWVFPNSGKQLKIGVPIRVSFKEFVSEVHGSYDMFKGFCVDVFMAAVNLLPYAVPYQFVGFGDGHKNPNYTDIVERVAMGELDAAIGDIAIVASRTKIVDYTQPYAATGLVVVTPYKTRGSGAWAFLRPFTPLMWGVIVVFFILVGVVVWMLEHRVNNDFRGPPRKQVITILWFSFSTVTFSQREDIINPLGRLVLLIWLFVVLILTSSYTASLSSILTVRQPNSHITGIDTLKTDTDLLIGFQEGSFAQEYLSVELNISDSRLVPLNSSLEYAQALNDGRVDAVVDERPYVELFLSSHCKFRVVGNEFTRSGWGFVFPRDSPLAQDMSIAILKLSENGDLQRIYDKWLTTSTCSLESTAIESSQLHLGSFLGLFLISGAACLISLIIFFAQICYRLCSTPCGELPSNSQSGNNSRSSHFQRFKSLMDEKKDSTDCSKKRRKTEESSSVNVNETRKCSEPRIPVQLTR